MICVRYDEDTDQICITGEDRSYARRSLIASLEGSDRIGIRMKFAGPTEFKVMTAYTNLMDAVGAGFATQAAAKAYLDGEFAKRRPSGDAHIVDIAISSSGQTRIPLDVPPSLLSTVRIEVNGVTYRQPDIAASQVAVDWLNPAFLLDPSDRVTLVYS